MVRPWWKTSTSADRVVLAEIHVRLVGGSGRVVIARVKRARGKYCPRGLEISSMGGGITRREARLVSKAVRTVWARIERTRRGRGRA